MRDVYDFMENDERPASNVDEILEAADEYRARKKVEPEPEMPAPLPTLTAEQIDALRLKLNRDKPETPERVAWSDLGPMPDEWRRISHPYPVPGGALFIVNMPHRQSGIRVYGIFSWNIETNEASLVTTGERFEVYGSNKNVRERIALIAKALCAA